jgi:hypothetical protein
MAKKPTTKKNGPWCKGETPNTTTQEINDDLLFCVSSLSPNQFCFSELHKLNEGRFPRCVAPVRIMGDSVNDIS